MIFYYFCSVSPSILNATNKILRQHPEVIAALSKQLHLCYRESKGNQSNVCFIESEEVRSEFREAFTSEDVGYYLIGLLKGAAANEVAKENFHLYFPYPKNADDFWQKIEQGRLVKDNRL